MENASLVALALHQKNVKVVWKLVQQEHWKEKTKSFFTKTNA